MTATKPLDEGHPVLALGLMSGTSLDGVDAALIRTDGLQHIETLGSLTLPYNPDVREQIRSVLGSEDYTNEIRSIERVLTLTHVEAVKNLLLKDATKAPEVHIIGFHGHTLVHRPEDGRTWQFGDAALLAELTQIDVVANFREADVAAGGEGAPLTPAFHAAVSDKLERPIAILNIGGVANVTWIGADETLVSFDTGPGNALIDDWMFAREGRTHDVNGQFAFMGTVDETVLQHLLSQPYFDRPPPKSLDRNAFDVGLVQSLTNADGAATLTAFTAESIACGEQHFPSPPRSWLVTGGGRNNLALMAALSARLNVPIDQVENVGWNGDALEAQAFAYLAVRSLRQFPLTFPGTTGVAGPTRGGHLYRVMDYDC